MNEHDVRLDYVGINPRTRITCYSCGETVIFQPYLNTKDWQEIRRKFLTNYPCTKIKDEGFRG